MNGPNTTKNLDISGRSLTRVRVALDAVTRAEIEQRGLEAPDEVVFLMREATLRERNRFHLDADDLGKSDPVGWMVQLLQARVEKITPDEVLEEFVLGLTEGFLAVFQEAYLSGVLADPKLMGRAVRRVSTELRDAMLNGLIADPSASSPVSESGQTSATN